MRQKRLLTSLSALATICALLLPQHVAAQEITTDVIGLNPNVCHQVAVEQSEDGSWTITTQGGDPYVATAPLTRDLLESETTLTFEYKSTDLTDFEIFFSLDAGHSFDGDHMISLGEAPATNTWTRVNVDLSQYIAANKWGTTGQTMRLDCSRAADVTFQIRDLRFNNAKVNVLEGFTLQNGAIQLNSQADFDKWVAAHNGFVSKLYMPDYDVDLNADVVAKNDSYIVHRMNKVFNGNGHKVTLDIVSEEGGCHFIQQLYGTIKNLTVDGTIDGKGKYLSGVVGDTFDGAVLRDVTSAVTIITSIVGDATNGGFVAVNKGNTLYKNCVFKGALIGAEATCCGGFVGWMERPATFDGCMMIADVQIRADLEGCNTIARNQVNAKVKNSFANVEMLETPEGCKIVTPEQMASGEVCFGLNGDQREICWYQNIGEDPLPVLDNTHKRVYAKGDFNCDGTLLGEATYSNTDTGSQIPDHTYNNGICDNCGHFQPDYVQQQDGWYIIDTPEKLVYIARYTALQPAINIKITSNLDMTGMTYEPMGGPFNGILDGMHHTISNLVINNPEANAQALVGVAGNCTVRNLTMDETCSITGKAFCAGFVGQTKGWCTIYLENLFMHGTVTGSAENIAGIWGCNMSSEATSYIANCGVTGTIVGGRESGLISGWLAGDKSTLTNCWATGTVSGCDNDETAFARPTNVAHNNCWSVQGKRNGVGKLSADAASSGELTWKLNGSSFINPTWFQNLTEGDAYPSLDSLRGIVYPVADAYATVDLNDPASFQTFKDAFNQTAQDYTQSADYLAYAGAVLAKEYAALADAYATATDMDSFVVVYKAEQAKKVEVEASITAYKNYEAAALDILNTLNNRNDFSGPDRDFLEGIYLSDILAPGEDPAAPNGTFEYIKENRQLTAKEVEAEIKFMKELLRLAIANGYEPGTDITSMMTNADFAKKFEGWKGVLFQNIEASPTEGSNMHAAEIWSNGAHDMYQEIVVGKKGLYELQVRGAYRPFDDENSTQLYPYIYLNDNANYLQADIEDMIPVAEAVDQVNCNITGPTSDRAIKNELGDTIGYVLHGMLSCNKAFEAGRYDNRIIVYVPNAGDTLKIGIKVPYSEFGGNEWAGIGDIHLTYCGEYADAVEALDRTVASMLARAKTLQNTAFSSDADYVKYPNYCQSLKDRLATAISNAEGAADEQAKYAAVVEMSAIFKEVIDAKKAYKNYFAEVERVVNHAYTALEVDESCVEIASKAEAVQQEGMEAYATGSLTVAEAKECALVKNIGVIPAQDEKGVYHITNSAQYSYFGDYSSRSGKALDAVLDVDVNMNEKMIINDFRGVFDGQDHTINVRINRTADNAAPFQNLRGATVKNLIVIGTIDTPNKYAAGLAAHAFDNVTIDRIQSMVHINGRIAGDGTHAGILAVNDKGTGKITNCLFGGTLSGNANSNGGIVGWADDGGVDVSNCLVIADITASAEGSNIMGRNKTRAKDCYYKVAYGSAPAGAYQITDEQLVNGYTTYGLNGGCTRKDVAWRQNLDGSDIHPTLDPTHKIVYMTADSVFTNELQHEIEKHEGSKADPYLIGTAKEMAILRRFLIPGRINYVVLTADIDMAEITNWEPLNMSYDVANNRGYQNIIDFDGKNHVISNFTSVDPSTSYNSFFGILNGSVRNVGFKDAKVVSAKSGTGILAGYMGHNDYQNADATKSVSRLENVWVSGTLDVESSYAGGLIGNVGGPSVIRNCYTNIAITSEAKFVGGIVGRVRDELAMEQVYAAGSITSQTGKVGGIIGGGQNFVTAPGRYNNIVVWNNADKNFGNVRPAVDLALPVADLMDIVFNEDGTVTDQSPLQHKVEVVGTPKVVYNDVYKQNVLVTEANDSTAKPISYAKVNYSNNEAFKQALLDGYTMETTFKVLNKEIITQIKPFSSQEGAGLGFEMDPNGSMKHVAYTKVNNEGGYRIATGRTPAQMDTYYHFLATYDKINHKVTFYVNGDKVETGADGELTLPTDTLYQWFGLGADPGPSGNGGNFEIVNARIYNEPVAENIAKALYFKQIGRDFFAADKQSNISYYDGTNFAALQQVVVDWGKPWKCDMLEGSYPTFDGTLADGIQNVTGNLTKGKIYNINGIRVEKTTKGIYIIDGKKVVVK